MNKTEESLVRLKRESTKIRNESGDMTTDSTEIKRILRVLWRTVCLKFDDLDERNKFLETQTARLNHKEAENTNRFYTDCGDWIKHLPTK